MKDAETAREIAWRITDSNETWAHRDVRHNGFLCEAIENAIATAIAAARAEGIMEAADHIYRTAPACECHIAYRYMKAALALLDTPPTGGRDSE